MNPDNVLSAILVGDNWDYVLFKTAINLAETGLLVWLISLETFEKVPEKIIPPDKEVLQLITFVYLKDYKDLITHLNEIHLWHKIPNVIILSGFDKYSRLYETEHNSLLTALMATSLLDSISTCARKLKKTTCLLVTSSCPPDPFLIRLKVLEDMYFNHVIHKASDDELLVENIVNYCLNK